MARRSHRRMKALLCLWVCMGCAVMAAIGHSTSCFGQATAAGAAEPKSDAEGKVLRHAVFFKFKPAAAKEDIERMIREAEEHAAEDKARREAAEVRNSAEQLAYSIDKLISENADKLPDDVKSEVQADVDALKTALAGTDDEAVKTAYDTLNASQTKLGEAIYAASQAEEAAPAAGAESSAKDEDVVDAEIVDDEDDKDKK